MVLQGVLQRLDDFDYARYYPDDSFCYPSIFDAGKKCVINARLFQNDSPLKKAEVNIRCDENLKDCRYQVTKNILKKETIFVEGDPSPTFTEAAIGILTLGLFACTREPSFKEEDIWVSSDVVIDSGDITSDDDEYAPAQEINAAPETSIDPEIQEVQPEVELFETAEPFCFDHTFKIYNSDVGISDTIQLENGAIIACGYNDGLSPWIVKFDPGGHILLDKNIGTSENQSCNKMLGVGNHVVAIGKQDNKARLFQFDEDGNILWENIAGADNTKRHFSFRSIRPTDDFGFIISGSIFDTSGFHVDNYVTIAWLLKRDASGKAQWSEELQSEQHNAFNDAIQTSDGSYIATGYAKISKPQSRMWIAKYDSNHVLLWDKKIETPGYDAFGKKIFELENGNYLVSGYFKAGFDVYDQGFFIEITPNGEVVSQSYFGVDGYEVTVHDVIAGHNGNYMVAANLFSHENGDNFAWIAEVAQDGKTVFDLQLMDYPAIGADTLLATADDNYLATSYFANSNLDYKARVFKIDDGGNVVCTQ